MAKLENEKHERFCQEYIIDLNVTKAYMRAYPDSSEKAAATGGGRLLRNAEISARLKELLAERQKRTQVTQDMVVQRLADIAFGHMGLISVWTDNGLELKSTEDMEEHELAIISSIQISPVSDGNGGTLGYNKKFTMKDSLKALELLCKHLGILDGQGTDSRNRKSIQGRLFERLSRYRSKA